MVDSLGFSIYQYNMSSAKSDHLNSSFLMGCLSWLSFFPWLYFSGKDFQYHTGWNWWVGILSSWSNWKSFQLFTVEYDVSSRLVIYCLYFVVLPSVYSHFVESFCHEWFFSFSNVFSARMSGSRWVTIPSWLYGSLRPFLYSSFVYSFYLSSFFPLFIFISWRLITLITSASVRCLLFLFFIVPIFTWMSPWYL